MDKADLLDYLSQTPGADAFTVASHFGVAYATAAMALLRLSRQGLVSRDRDSWSGRLQYALTGRGYDRLAFFNDRAYEDDQAYGGTTMKHAKSHTGTFHCPNCLIEYDLIAEPSLKCPECQGPLAAGGLDEIWDTEEDG